MAILQILHLVLGLTTPLSPEQPFEGFHELREIVLDGVPQNVGIDIKVRVNDAVPQGSHHEPRHIRVGFLNVFGDVIGVFASALNCSSVAPLANVWISVMASRMSHMR